MPHKNWQLVLYIKKYGWAKIKKKMNKLILSLHLKKQATDIFLESFKSFSYIKVDKKH